MFSFVNNIKVQTLIVCIFTWLFDILGCLIIIKFKKLNKKFLGIFYSIASGLMLGSLFFSMILSSYDYINKILWIISFVLGYLFLIVIEKLFIKKDNKCIKLSLALSIHNIPEGIALGMILLSKKNVVSFTISLAISNIIDGIFSIVPFKEIKVNNKKSFLFAFIISLIEPLVCILCICLNHQIIAYYPIIMSFCSGTIIYVIFTELIKESNVSITGSLLFIISFISVILL